MFLLMTVLLTACSSSKEEVVQPVEEDCFLEIPICAPERPIVTRGDVGEIASSEAERTVHSLQIWVFKSKDGSLVCYRKLTDFTSLNAAPSYQQTYKMKVDRTFAEVRDNVDIYVVANAASCGFSSYDDETDRATLNGAVIGTDYFGTSSLISTSDIQTNGLPMSAVLKNQPIYGSFPALRIGSQEQPAVLELTRAVSKLRFVLCQKEGNQNSNKSLVSIDDIKLHRGQIPKETYLMPGTTTYPANYFVADTEPSDEISFGSVAQDAIPEVKDPLVYTYETQAAQDYENLIDAAVKGDIAWLKQYGNKNNIDDLKNLDDNSLPQLKQVGLTYLRESDKQLTGTISYTYNDNNTPTTKDVAFSMAGAGDFLRNHSWIVYIYYMDSEIHVLTVTHIGMKKWTSDGNPEDATFYNW